MKRKFNDKEYGEMVDFECRRAAVIVVKMLIDECPKDMDKSDFIMGTLTACLIGSAQQCFKPEMFDQGMDLLTEHIKDANKSMNKKEIS